MAGRLKPAASKLRVPMMVDPARKRFKRFRWESWAVWCSLLGSALGFVFGWFLASYLALYGDTIFMVAPLYYAVCGGICGGMAGTVLGLVRYVQRRDEELQA